MDRMGSDGAQGIGGDFAQFIPVHRLCPALGFDIDAVSVAKHADPAALLTLRHRPHRPVDMLEGCLLLRIGNGLQTYPLAVDLRRENADACDHVLEASPPQLAS